MTSTELHMSHLVVGGAALAREASGRVVFVSGALPGETVLVEFRTSKKDFATAEVLDVLVASADRVDPPCEAWQRGCGGCDWQHIEAGAQLRNKTAIVAEALTRMARLVDPVVVAAGAVEPWGYRTTVRVAVAAGAVGFRSRRSHHVVPVAHCPVAAAGVDAALAGVGPGLPGGADEVVIRTSVATGEVNVSTDPLRQVLHENVVGHRFRVSLGSFFQSSPQAAELLVAAVDRAIADIDLSAAHVVDAYGGIGLFAVTSAAAARSVTVVEGSASACADARENLAGREAVVVESRIEDWTPVGADLVIADPARSGLDKDAVSVLAATGTPVLVLISCDTGSLTRDTRLLLAAGFEHDGTQVIDAFPNTSHIETVTRFVRPAGRAGIAGSDPTR